MNWLRSNVWEIQRSRLLSYLGTILSLIHVVNYFYWVNRSQVLNPTHNSTLLCWDFTSHCGPLVNLSPQFFAALLTGYLGLSCFAALGFISRRLTGVAWSLLLVVNLIKILFYLSDASLAVDVQALLLFLNFGFLFVPSKASLARYSIIVFYFVEGFRELTPDWLTGKSLQGTYPLPMKGLEWVAAFSIIFRWTLPWLLTSPVGQRLAIAVVGLFAFHAANFYFKSDFESVVMISFVIFFLLDFFEHRRVERESLYQSYALPEPSKLWWPIFLSLFIIAQIPRVAKDSALSLLKVEGPASISDCVQVNFANFENRVEQINVEAAVNLKPQLKCMASIALNAVKSLCPELSKQPGFKSLSSYFLSRGLAEAHMRTVFAEENVCPGTKVADASTPNVIAPNVVAPNAGAQPNVIAPNNFAPPEPTPPSPTVSATTTVLPTPQPSEVKK